MLPSRPAAVLSLSLPLLVVPAPARSVERPQDAPRASPPKSSPKGGARLASGDHRRGDLVAAYLRGRQLLTLGRQSGEPLLLLAAAQLLQRTPAPVPLQGVEGEPATSEVPPELAAPSLAELLEETRGAARRQGGPALGELLALVDPTEQSEVTTRGGTRGPQQLCGALPARSQSQYDIKYEASDRAVAGLVGEGQENLAITVSDAQGATVGSGQENSLIAWYPPQRGVYRITVENRGQKRLHFCLETN